MTRPQPAREPEYLRRYGWDSGMDQPPFAQITSCQRFIGPDGRRDWLVLHVAPNGHGIPPRLVTTNVTGAAWVEPSPDGFWSNDDGFVLASAWDVSRDPSYAEPAPVVRALVRGTVIVPPSPTGSDEVDAAPLRARTTVGADGRRRLNVFSTVSSLTRGNDSAGHARDVVAGTSVADVAEHEGASIVGFDVGSAHHLEISTSDLRAYAGQLRRMTRTAR